MATTQSLTLTQVSQSVESNRSLVRILWTTTQTGSSYNNYEKVGYYWVSINGGPETKYTVYSTLPLQSTKTIVDVTIEVAHNTIGDCTVDVRTSMDTAISAGVITRSASLKLDNIPRPSVITSASNVTLGNPCSVKWIPMSPAFCYKLGFQIGDWKHSTEVVHPNKTTEYTYTGLTIPLEVAKQIPNDPSGTMYVYLHTFADSAGMNQIGNTSSATFKVTVPDNKDTKPIVTMELSAVHSLPDKFSGLFIQGKSKVKGDLTADGQFDTDIQSYSMTVGSVSYGAAEGYTSDYLSTYGPIKVTGYATDNRGYTGEVSREIDVIAYRDPKLENVSAVRCDENGNDDEAGNYLKIAAKISYAPIVSNENQKNFCQVRFRYAIEGRSLPNTWTPIFESTNWQNDEVVTEALLDGRFLATNTYRVEVQAVDDIGNTALATFIVPTDKVYWHRDGKRNALGLGKYNEKDDAIDSAWDFYMNGHKVTGLPTPEGDTDAVPLGFLQDYIVEQGTSGIWTYCKWNSGRAELWGYGSATYENGNVLASEEFGYPFALTSAFCGIGTLNSYGGNAAESLPWNLKLAYGSDKCKIWIHNSGGGFTASSTVDASVYIVGRWKR